jgi:hypothetical protein
MRHPITLLIICVALSMSACSGENPVAPDAAFSGDAVVMEMQLETACVGNEGCTPGYWKNHEEDWPATGLGPNDDFDTTFGVDLFDPDITLFEAVWAKGGHENRLARHGTAALLNALHPGVEAYYTPDEVIAMVQSGQTDALETANELGCPM